MLCEGYRGVGIGSWCAKEVIRIAIDEYQIKNLSVAKKYEGTALSLPIARKLVHKFNGTIWCTPNTDQGSIFTFIIPIDRMSFEQ